MSSKLRSAAGHQAAPDAEQPDAEIRMRRALGLESAVARTVVRRAGGASVAHRDSRNAEAPVNRAAEAEAALAAERQAREQAETMLRKAETALRETETRLGHAELARDEALAALASERSARQAAEERIRQLTSTPPPEPTAAPKKRGRPPRVAVPQAPAAAADAPVEWWLPGWKARLPRSG